MKEVEEKQAKQTENLENGTSFSTDTEEREEELSKYMVIPDMFITRKTVKKGGRVYNDYFVNGVLRGVQVQVRVRPGKDSSGFTDVSSYTMLDIVFGSLTSVQFAVQSYKRRDLATNRSVTGYTYHAYSKDPKDGEEWTAPLRFETSSDKAMIMKMIEVANRDHELGLIL